jgi:hypothetical protein
MVDFGHTVDWSRKARRLQREDGAGETPQERSDDEAPRTGKRSA